MWVALLGGFAIPSVAHADVVNIPDAGLRFSLERSLGKAPGDPITDVEMASLTYLAATDKNIEILTGLETAVNLNSLNLLRNNIQDLTPVSSLSQLKSLNLNENDISDLSPLSGLTGLIYLYLFDNAIDDLTDFPQLSGPREIWLSYNMITDITPLLGLVEVNNLDLLLHHNLLDLSDGSQSRNVIDTLESAGADVRDAPQKEVAINLYSETLYVAGISGDLVSGEFVIRNQGDLNLEYSLSPNEPWINPEVNQGVILPHDYVIIPLEIGPIPEYENVLTGGITIASNDLSDPSIELSIVISPPVDIPDDNLRAAVEDRLYKDPNEVISTAEMGLLKGIGILDKNITSLEGLQWASNLERLSLVRNNLSDISPISGLTKLTVVNILENQVSDISPLAGLTCLTDLELNNNLIGDLTPLAGLSGLNKVDLRHNNLRNISPIDGMGPEQIRVLLISHNHLNIDEGSDAKTVIDGLRDSGVIVHFEPQSDPDIELIQRDVKFAGIPGQSLQTDILVWNHGQNDLSFTIGTSAPWIQTSFGSGNIPYDKAITIRVTMGPIPEYVGATNPTITFHSNDPKSPAETISYSLTPPFLVPDNALRGAIRTALDKNPDQKIATAEMEDVRMIKDMGTVEDLTGLEAAVNLEFLRINTSLADVSLIGSLSQLSFLDLSGDNITNISLIQELENLEGLRISCKQLKDLSPIAGLSGLKSLDLTVSPAASLAPLASLSSLESLSMFTEGLRDISALSGLTSLEMIQIMHTQISNLSPLANLTGLKELHLGYNWIKDITGLADLTSLTYLRLDRNQITDLSPLSRLTELKELTLQDNQISDISPLLGLTQLDKLRLNYNYLDLGGNSPVHGIVVTLRNAGAFVEYDYQSHPGVLAPEDEISLTGNADDIATTTLPIRNTADVDLEYSFDSTNDLVDFEPDSGIISPGMEIDVHLTFGPIPDGWNILSGVISVISNDLYNTRVYIPYKIQAKYPIPDTTLLAAINTALGQDPGAAVREEQLATVLSLEVHSGSELDLTGLEAAINLQSLNLSSSYISDLSPLAHLSHLYRLDLSHCRISDLSEISGLTGIEELWLDGNQITDLIPLAGMRGLRKLHLSDNAVGDLSSLEGMTEMTELVLSKNRVINIIPLAGLNQLEHVYLTDNYIDVSDVSECRTMIDQWVANGVQVTYMPQGEPGPQTHQEWTENIGLPLDSRGEFQTNGSLRIQNLLAYTLGINPLSATEEQLPVSGFDGETGCITFSYSYNTRSTGVEIGFEASTDMETWESISPMGTRVVSVDCFRNQYREASFDGSENLFLRLSVRKSPNPVR